MDDRELQAMVEEVDKDGSGELEMVEFVAVVKKLLTRVRTVEVVARARPTKASCNLAATQLSPAAAAPSLPSLARSDGRERDLLFPRDPPLQLTSPPPRPSPLKLTRSSPPPSRLSLAPTPPLRLCSTPRERGGGEGKRRR